MSDRSDAETTELLLEWLREYGLTIVIGIILGLIAIFAYQTYNNNTEQKLQANSAKLMQLRMALQSDSSDSNIEQIYAELKNEKGFSEWAALLYGNDLLHKQKYDDALSILQRATSSKDDFITQSAWFQIAQIQIATDKFDDATKTIERLRGGFLNDKLSYLQRNLLLKQGKLSEALATFPTKKSHLLALEEAAIRARLAVAQ